MRKERNGITLIALVITIIVLLILAGVSISTLTGESGILSKANSAKNQTDQANAKEQGQIAVYGSYDNNGRLDIEQLKTELGKINKVGTITDTNGDFPIKTTIDGHGITIDKNGTVTVEGESITPTKPSTVQEAITLGTVLDENNPTTITDTYGNSVKVPKGFKIASDSATDITGGVVIEDVSYGTTAGSQFVWIPVGTIYTNVEQTESETIALNRYTFDSNGNPIAQGEKVIDSYYQELKASDKGNIVAKDIEAFKTSVEKNGGYYIGRYEARSVTERVAKTDELKQITVKPNDYVYNYLTQAQATTLAQKMYGEDKMFTSDLVNSYAWDTAIVFLQIFDNRIDKTKPYSRQNSLNTSMAIQGTNNLEDITKQDEICNIWDMASNGYEMTTETCTRSGTPYTGRGGKWSNSEHYVSIRGCGDMSNANEQGSFRIILYL